MYCTVLYCTVLTYLMYCTVLYLHILCLLLQVFNLYSKGLFKGRAGQNSVKETEVFENFC